MPRMRTPAGKDCTFFYGDYFRGRDEEECRLLKDHELEWTPDLCSNCSIPDIELANACEFMQFTPKVERALIIVGKKQVYIDTYCSKCTCSVDEPRIGCGQCHPLPDIFIVAPDDPDAAV